jgi:hypothetical protein
MVRRRQNDRAKRFCGLSPTEQVIIGLIATIIVLTALWQGMGGLVLFLITTVGTGGAVIYGLIPGLEEKLNGFLRKDLEQKVKDLEEAAILLIAHVPLSSIDYDIAYRALLSRNWRYVTEIPRPTWDGEPEPELQDWARNIDLLEIVEEVTKRNILRMQARPLEDTPLNFVNTLRGRPAPQTNQVVRSDPQSQMRDLMTETTNEIRTLRGEMGGILRRLDQMETPQVQRPLTVSSNHRPEIAIPPRPRLANREPHGLPTAQMPILPDNVRGNGHVTPPWQRDNERRIVDQRNRQVSQANGNTSQTERIRLPLIPTTPRVRGMENEIPRQTPSIPPI